MKRARDLIAGSIGTLPLQLFDSGRNRTDNRLFDQPERDVPRSVTMTRTLEDLLFEGVAWWRITEFAWHGYPVQVVRLDPRSVSVQQNGRVYHRSDGTPQGSADEWVKDSELIRFDSPNGPLLTDGARAIRTCLALDAAASRYADEPLPLGYFTPAEGIDPADDDEILTILNAWQAARQSRANGYVPAALKYQTAQFTPEQLQLADARQHAVLEIARCAGVDPEELGVSTTSRTYANQYDRRKFFVDFTLGGYMSAVQDRLSMGDVTPRGHYARFNLDAFLRSDTLSRYQAYEVGLRVGALDGNDIAALEDKPTARAPSPVSDPVEEPVTNTADAATFDAPEVAVRLDASTDATFTVDAESRTITGLALPFDTTARSNGRDYRFSRGTVRWGDPSRVKLLVGHDFSTAVGYATSLEEGDGGLVASFKVARGAEGDRALTLAEDRVLDGLSVGLGAGGKWSLRDGVHHALEANLAEISLTPCPAFDDARLISVTASREERTMPETVETTQPVDFTAITDAISAGFANLSQPQGPGREVVSAGGATQVREELPYRFDGMPAAHSFSADLRSMAGGDAEARQRLETFLEEAFAVTTTNVGSLNPTQNRPELWVPNLTYTRPLWDLCSTGVVNDKTPFTVPKFSAASGLVGNHTEGVEPTPGSFSATNQTITPAPMSGKIEINREVWDQGGSPQADQIIWAEMLNGYYEAIEAKIAAALNALALTETNLASAVNTALVDAVTGILVDLQFARGGNRYTAFAADGMFFKALANAQDSGGRKLLPIIGPANAQGSTDGNFARIYLGSQPIVPAWALGATNTSNSYLFVPSSVWCWASAPKKFLFEYQVKSIDMAIWGYAATAVLRDTDVKRIDYTTADV